MNDYQTMRELCRSKAEQLWASFDKNQKAGVRFGMFPAKEMEAAIAAGHDSRLLSVALMDCASADGVMRA